MSYFTQVCTESVGYLSEPIMSDTSFGFNSVLFRCYSENIRIIPSQSEKKCIYKNIRVRKKKLFI